MEETVKRLGAYHLTSNALPSIITSNTYSASNGHNGWICGNYDAIQITRLWNGHMIRQISKASRTCRHQKECIKHKEAAPRNICKYVVHHQKGTTDPKGTTQPLEMIPPMGHLLCMAERTE
eukprot:725170_1